MKKEEFLDILVVKAHECGSEKGGGRSSEKEGEGIEFSRERKSPTL